MKQQHQQQQQQQHQQSLQFNKKKYSIEYQLKDFICVYVTNEEQSKQILLNRGKFKMPKLNSIKNFKEFMNEKTTNEDVIAYNNIAKKQKNKKINT